ncbi:DnaB-like helicase C-terminal domain-containing protein [Streptomyces chumphonensis]|uniref:DnaB-like helicase C-terminal domain-containing protein n=1 Tax=Streptomyces chumphonensis TaxID=1214925 RepID=A0A927F3H8_9ACTN|nr:DnaB-like helicase C-terminal domain-containing protein [Streptomyces chumphonensis]MBD3934870.1 DnaB-like helicase C-terminal domain-containing protein [Streptomyces chumphonensis]
MANHARKADARRLARNGRTYRSALHLTRSKPRVPTGLSTLDDLLQGGLKPGRLTVLASRTGMGKSMLALHIARHCSFRERRPALIASLEMSRHEHMMRIAAAETGILSEHLRRRNLTPDQRARIRTLADELNGAPLLFGGDRSAPTVAEIQETCAQATSQAGSLDLLIVDNLGLMRGARSVSRTRECTLIVEELTGLARSLNAAVIIVEQLTRAPELRTDHRPRLRDMQHLEALAPHAETVVLLHRDAYYIHPKGREPYFTHSPDPRVYPEVYFPRWGLPAPVRQHAELHVPLHRQGRTGTLHVEVDLSTASFYDLPPTSRSQHR